MMASYLISDKVFGQKERNNFFYMDDDDDDDDDNDIQKQND